MSIDHKSFTSDLILCGNFILSGVVLIFTHKIIKAGEILLSVVGFVLASHRNIYNSEKLLIHLNWPFRYLIKSVHNLTDL